MTQSGQPRSLERYDHDQTCSQKFDCRLDATQPRSSPPTLRRDRRLVASSLAKGADLESFKRAFVKTMRPSSLIGRFAETKEVANLVVFLCGEGSSAITGAS